MATVKGMETDGENYISQQDDWEILVLLCESNIGNLSALQLGCSNMCTTSEQNKIII